MTPMNRPAATDADANEGALPRFLMLFLTPTLQTLAVDAAAGARVWDLIRSLASLTVLLHLLLLAQLIQKAAEDADASSAVARTKQVSAARFWDLLDCAMA